jgi:aryl-alcohol dehydrogenase-like predicted oxidoreductase
MSSESPLISQDESSETFIGEWAEKRGIRDQLVIATKVLLASSTYFGGMLRPGSVYDWLQTGP